MEFSSELMGIQIPSNRTRTGSASQLLSITDKITKALDNFDALFDEGDQDAMLNDITDKVNGLESGELKYQLKDFINKYKDMNSNLDNVSQEREEILSSLADWFEMASSDMDISGDNLTVLDSEIAEGGHAINDGLVNTKMGFDKLKRLNEEIISISARGRDVAHLKHEKHMLEKTVIQNFKAYKNEKKKIVEEAKANEKAAEMDPGEKEQLQKAWSNAADEICGMLKNVREKGSDYTTELEKKVKDLLQQFNQQGQDLTKVKRELGQKVMIEKKIQEENIELTSKKARLVQKCKKFKKELIATRKRLANFESLGPLGRSALESESTSDDLDTNDNPQEYTSNASSGEITSGDPTILKAQLRDCKNQIAKFSQENTEMQERLKNITEELEEKDEDIAMLEHDKAELLHQMKKASIRPNVKELSSANIAESAQKKTFSGSVTGISIAKKENASPRCSQCNCHLQMNASSLFNDGPSLDSGSTENIDKTVSSSNALTRKTEEIEHLEEVCRSKDNAIHELEQKIIDLSKEISESGKTTGTRELAKKRTGAVTSKSNEEKRQKKSVTSSNATKTLKSAKDVNKKAQKGTKKFTPMEPSRTSDMLSNVDKSITADHQEVLTEDKCVQTDPSKDPIGAWSQEIKQADSWRPPIPPANWIEYDPTSSSLPEGQSSLGQMGERRDSVAMKMMKGAEPAQIRADAINCANFIERELQRVYQGISSFADYTNILVDREATLMAMANNELRTHLSQTELSQLQEKLGRPPSAGLRGSDIDLTEDANLPLFFADDEDGSNISAEERIKHNIGDFAAGAMESLKKTTQLVYQALQAQHRQYQHIFEAMQKKPRKISPDGIQKISKLENTEEIEDPYQPKLKKSQSHNDLVNMLHFKDNRELQDEGGKPHITKSKSYTGIGQRKFEDQVNFAQLHLSSQHNMPADKGKYVDKSVALNKEKMNLTMATVPKKGMIKLLTPTEMNKDQEVARKKVKPSPMSHKKLLLKQNALVTKFGFAQNQFTTPKRGQLDTHKSKNPQSKLDFSRPQETTTNISFGQLEKKAAEFAESTRHSHGAAMPLDAYKFPKLGDIEKEQGGIEREKTSTRSPRPDNKSDKLKTKLPPIA